ncbi:MAG: S41 family peptidase [Bacteroidia bacterium]|nr:S41 family peptidase [Bacteroidia bacterium]
MASYQIGTAQQSQISLEARDSIVQNTASLFERHYVFPEKGRLISEHLHQEWKKGRFAQYSNPLRFRKALQLSIREVVNDPHIILIYIGGEKENPEPTPASYLQREYEKRRAMNFGIPEARFLEGNIAYLKITKFTSPELFAPVIESASNFLAESDAMILDLRSRGGGNSYTVRLLLSYFLPAKTHLFNWYYREVSEEIEETWTLPFVAGKQFLDIPLVVLTSEKTFSGSEAFAFALQMEKRAQIIGETSRGGAHTYKEMFPAEDFLLLVPIGQALHPQSQENWEGKGVIPDISVPADQALEFALKELKEVLKLHD